MRAIHCNGVLTNNKLWQPALVEQFSHFKAKVKFCSPCTFLPNELWHIRAVRLMVFMIEIVWAKAEWIFDELTWQKAFQVLDYTLKF